MPAALADQTASSVAPDEILRPQRLAVGQLDVDAGVVLRETRHLTSAIDRHRQLVDPAGQDALDVVLPQPEPVVVPGGKVADVQRDPGEPRDLRHLSLARGTDRRFHADRGPRWCVSADRLRASRRGPGWRAARQWRRRPPPTPTRPPTSALSDLLRRSPPHARSSPHSGRHHAGRDQARRVPATAPRVPPSVRRPRATRTSTTTHAFRDSHLASAGDYAARPGACFKALPRYRLVVERSGLLSTSVGEADEGGGQTGRDRAHQKHGRGIGCGCPGPSHLGRVLMCADAGL